MMGEQETEQLRQVADMIDRRENTDEISQCLGMYLMSHHRFYDSSPEGSIDFSPLYRL